MSPSSSNSPHMGRFVVFVVLCAAAGVFLVLYGSQHAGAQGVIPLVLGCVALVALAVLGLAIYFRSFRR